MNVVLWIVQAVLALAFLTAGTSKLTQPREKLVTNMGWVEDFSEGLSRSCSAPRSPMPAGTSRR